MAELAVAAGIAGAGMQAVGSIQQGRAALADAKFVAKQQEQAAKQNFAAEQRQAINARREAQLLRSKFIANAAAQGGGLNQPSLVNELVRIDSVSDYNVGSILSTASDRLSGANTEAQATRMRGTAAERAMRMQAIGQLFSGASQAAGYGGKKV